MKPRKVIVFGGVFDPVHEGHIATARQALKNHGDMVVFLPERKPWRKHGRTDYSHRYAMIEMALMHDDSLEVRDYPEDRQTIVGVFTWLNEYLPGSEFVWLMGSDVLPLVTEWPDIHSLSDYGVVKILVVNRDSNSTRIPSKLHAVEVAFMDSPVSNLSSSDIRSGIAQLVPSEVDGYIKKQALYKSEITPS